MSEDKGWQVEIHAKRAPDADGWRVYVMVSLGTGDAVRSEPCRYPSRTAARSRRSGLRPWRASSWRGSGSRSKGDR